MVAVHADELRTRFGIERIAATDSKMFYANFIILTVVILAWVRLANRACPQTLGVYSLAFLCCFFSSRYPVSRRDRRFAACAVH